MIYSMTGYGKWEEKNEEIKTTIEIKSLNSKGLDISLKAPSALRTLDMEIRNYIQNQLQRGKVDVFITIEYTDESKMNLYDAEELKLYYHYLKNIADVLHFSDKNNPYIEANLFREAMNIYNQQHKNEDDWLNEENKQLIMRCIEKSCELVNDFRKKEGKKLEEDIIANIKYIEEEKSRVASREPERKLKIKEKILTALKENLDVSKINTERLEQEMIYYIEKIDINEELVRLNSHIQYFYDIIQNGYGMGRKLSFVAQEIGREINTIGSKANDDYIQKHVVEMKDALEKIKEQLNNVL
ncbi:MAG: YicC family protein [Bacteroidia bacterium]|nr:YicC family protein [Bacteroidia bacterium]